MQCIGQSLYQPASFDNNVWQLQRQLHAGWVWLDGCGWMGVVVYRMHAGHPRIR